MSRSRNHAYTPTEAAGIESLDQTAKLAMEFGRLSMQIGSSAHYVEKIASQVAFGLGADRMALHVGFSSLILTIGKGSAEVTRLCKIGPLGVNQRLHHGLSLLAIKIERGELTISESRQELDQLLHVSKHYPAWFVAVAVGTACAAFGRVLDVDWRSVGPIFFAAAIAQMVRQQLGLHAVNLFISVTLVAFLGSVLSGLGARWVGSQTVAKDMVATVLLLVPGVPAFNAELDILDGRPALGTARAVWVAVMMVTTAVGVWLGLGLLQEGR
jgi:uncharacterized membrane protein YjjP (DUF1212 family)